MVIQIPETTIWYPNTMYSILLGSDSDNFKNKIFTYSRVWCMGIQTVQIVKSFKINIVKFKPRRAYTSN